MTIEDILAIEKLNELRLDASNPISRGKTFVLLEGEDDCRIFSRLLARHCKIEWFPGGKIQLEKHLKILVEDPHFQSFIIGIRDADFLHLEGQTSGFPELFLTDFHDLEMMMLAEDECFEAILAEFSNSQNDLLVRENLLESLRFVSYLRWWNDQNKAELTFKEFKFGDIFDPSHLRIDVERYLYKLVERSANAIEKDINVLKVAANSLVNKDNNIFQLCNGHDFMDILSLYFNAKRTQKGVTPTRLNSQFRTAYSKLAFYKTQLYANLQKWASENHTTI